MRALLLLLCLGILSAAFADDKEKDKVYKWVDDKGVIHYGSRPPDQNVKPAKLPPLQTYPGGKPPDLTTTPAPVKDANAGAAPKATVNILSPQPDETFREADQQIAVAVEVPGGLANRKLTYYLDGVLKGGPTPATTLSMAGVERGEHTLAVALVDPQGKEVGRSAPVTFHMKPPSATKPAMPAPRSH
jgi:hypothetical protein